MTELEVQKQGFEILYFIGKVPDIQVTPRMSFYLVCHLSSSPLEEC